MVGMQLENADIVIVDQKDVEEVYPTLSEEQTLLSEDEFTEGRTQFNLIVSTEETGDKPEIATQLGTHILNGKSVIDLREKNMKGFEDWWAKNKAKSYASEVK